MRMLWRVVAIGFVAVVVLVVAGVAALVLMDWNALRGRAEGFLSASAGRDVRLGYLDVEPGFDATRIVLHDFRIANAEGFGDQPLARIDELRMTIATWPLLRGQLDVLEAVLREPEFRAEVAEDGRVNWELGAGAEAAGEVAKPEERTEFPYIGRLAIEEGRMIYRDATRGLDLEGTVSTATGETRGNIEMALEGTLEKEPVRLGFDGGPLAELREPAEPYPFEISIDAGDTEVRAKGTSTAPVQLQGIDIDLRVAGPSMDDIFPIFGIPLPPTAPYSVEGRLRRDGQKWRFDDFTGNVDDSDLNGRLAVDYAPETPTLEAELTSKKLDFHDLGGLIGLEPGGNEQPAPDPQEESGLLPDTPLDLERLEAMDMDVRLTAERVNAQSLPIDRLDMRFLVKGGRVHVEPLVFYVAEGRIAGAVTVDGSQSPPEGVADLAVRNLDLKPFFADSALVEEMGGRFVGYVDLRGTGQSLAEMLGASGGSLVLGMRDGNVSALIVEAVGLDLVEALGLVVQGDVAIGIRCGRVNLKVSDGVAQFDRSVIDTTDSVLLVGGGIDLGKELLDVKIEAREKDFSLIDAAAPVRIMGSFADPELRIGGVDPLPFFEMGEQTNLDCDELLAGADRAEGQ